MEFEEIAAQFGYSLGVGRDPGVEASLQGAKAEGRKV